jgi:hypothetical protein
VEKITKIDIITRPEKLEELKEAMNAIAVTGMTVTQVYGCGLQKGYKEIYRGKEVSINLVPIGDPSRSDARGGTDQSAQEPPERGVHPIPLCAC